MRRDKDGNGDEHEDAALRPVMTRHIQSSTVIPASTEAVRDPGREHGPDDACEPAVEGERLPGPKISGSQERRSTGRRDRSDDNAAAPCHGVPRTG